MLSCSCARWAVFGTTAARLQFAGACGGGDGSPNRRRSDESDSAREEHTIEGFFGAFRKRFAQYELSKDDRIDAAARSVVEENEGTGGGASRAGSRPIRISQNRAACPRSVLFSPASKPRAMQKIPEIDADCFILDLEDSVGPSVKREAREHLREFVASVDEGRRLAERHRPEDAHRFRKRLVVRINSPDFDATNAMLDLELVGLLGPSIEGVAIPKVTTRTYDLIKDRVYPDHTLWGFFESPRSILEAPQICLSRHYRYAVLGFNDLANELQLPVSATNGDRIVGGSGPDCALARDLSEAELAVARQVARLPLLHSALQVMLAARAADMYVLDAVFNDPTDAAGFRQDLLTCRAMGFNGKTLIHPSQVGPTNAAYAPTPVEVEWASRIKEAVANAKGGVATVDGKMVEELHVRQADRTLDLNHATEAEKDDAEVGHGDTEAFAADAPGSCFSDSTREKRRDGMVRRPPSRQSAPRS